MKLHLRIYIVGGSPNSMRALANLKAICDAHLVGRYELEVVDALEDPQRCLKDGMLITPALLKVSPAPQVKLIGDLSDRQQVMLALGFPAACESQ
jgi:circadian clock protein KaiB